MVIIISSKANTLSTIQTKDNDHENYQSYVYRRRCRSFTNVSSQLRAERYRNVPDYGRCRGQTAAQAQQQGAQYKIIEASNGNVVHMTAELYK